MILFWAEMCFCFELRDSVLSSVILFPGLLFRVEDL